MKRAVFFMTFLFSFLSSAGAFLVQKNGEHRVSRCSYLDPLLIDILAFLAAGFLIIDGLWSMVIHRHEPLWHHVTRALRVAFGFAILTLHTMQVLHK